MEKLFIRTKIFLGNISRQIAFYPTIISLSGILLALIMLMIDPVATQDFIKKYAPSLIIEDADTARTILTTFIGGIISLMVFSFSMVMLLLNQASTNYSPRILPELISTRRHQVVFGFYMGTILYCVLTLINLRTSGPEEELPSFAIIIGILLGIFVLSLFIYFIHSISQAIQINYIITRIFEEAEARLSFFIKEDQPKDESDFPDYSEWNYTESLKTGYFRDLSTDTLMTFCKENSSKLAILVSKGTFVTKGMPIIACDCELTEYQKEKLESAISLSSSEIVGEDYILGFKQLTEIAVKAMSPGINDPGTAITCLDYLTQLFSLRLKKSDLLYELNEDNEKVIFVKTINFDELLYFVFVPLREYCKHDVIMLTKMLSCLKSLRRSEMFDESFKTSIIEEVKRLKSDIENSLSNENDKERLMKMSEELLNQD